MVIELAPEKYGEIQDAIAAIKQALLDGQKAIDAGIDVSGVMAELDDRLTRLTNIRDVYFPNGRP